MVDADYSGFESSYLTQMIEPIRFNKYDSTNMRWGNSFFLTHLTKFDILSGTRVLPKYIFEDHAYFFEAKGF